jgi:hypothetical protein
MILFKAFQNKHLLFQDLASCPSNYDQINYPFQLILEKKLYIIIIIYLNTI